MSIYVTRFIEVKKRAVNSTLDITKINNKELLDELPIGGYYAAWEKGFKHYFRVDTVKATNEKVLTPVDEKEIPCKWELVEWYSRTTAENLSHEEEGKMIKHNNFCDNGGPIRDVYLSALWGNGDTFADRGWPEDMSERLKEVFANSEYINQTYNHTYVTLSEWGEKATSELENFRRKLVDAINNKNFKTIHEKLDLLILKAKDPFNEPEDKKKKKDEEYIEEFDEVAYLFEEEFYDYLSIIREKARVWSIVDEIYPYVDSSNVRIIYYFS
jgi:hypothetical protein